MKIEAIQDDQLHEALELMGQLRQGLGYEELLRRYRIQELLGYKLIAATNANSILGLAGFRMVHTFARGLFVDIDDLVVAESHRRQGIGKALLNHVARYAQERNAAWLFLNARQDAIPFYERLGLEMHSAPAMKLALK